VKRIGIIQVWQESNSFNPVLTTISDFQVFGTEYGLKALDKFIGEEIGGFLDGLKTWVESVEPVGLVATQAWPGGPLSKDTKQWLKLVIDEQLGKAGRLDGILFSLHGGLVGEDESDVEGFLLEQVRNTVGSAVPIVATIDLHAHLTARMCRCADVLVAYHTNPHIDRFQTGLRASAVMEKIFSGAKPTLALVNLPMLVSGEVNTTNGEIFGPVFQRLLEIDANPDVLSASALLVQPHLDVPNLATAIAIYTNNQKTLAKEFAHELAQLCWQKREQISIELLDAEKAVTAALTSQGKPIVIADGADATNSGAPGDSVHLLAQLLKHPIDGGALTIMVEPEAVAYANTIGVNVTFEFAVGGKLDNIFSKPLPVKGQVISLQPARYTLTGHLANNLPIDMGNSAVIRTGDVTLLLVEKRGPGSTPMMYRCVGLEPKDFKIVVVKSPAGFRAEFEPFAGGIILSACPGCASPYLEQMPYKKINRPLWPFDKFENWCNIAWPNNINER